MTNSPLSILDLRDIVEPPPVGWWPLSPSAGVLVGLWLLALGLVAWQLRRRYRANAYRRAALRELEEVRRVFASAGKSGAAPGGGTRPTGTRSGQPTNWSRVSELLKRTALAAFPRTEVARLNGAEWVRWLNATGHGAAFVGPPARLLADAAYDQPPPDPGELEELIEQAAGWIRRHRVPPRSGPSSTPPTAS